MVSEEYPKYGGRYWFHCEICGQEFHLDKHKDIPAGVLHMRKTLECGKQVRCFSHEDCWAKVFSQRHAR